MKYKHFKQALLFKVGSIDNNKINDKNMKTMKIMRRLMGCAAAILALSACSESEDLLSAFHSDPNAVRITAQVGKASADGFTRSNPLGTTEADQAKFNENDEISVQAEGQDAVTYKYDGKEWQPQGNKFLKWENETMKFTAYYPATFNGTINQPTEYNKEADLAAADFMSFTGNVKNPGDNSLTLKMNRLMARVVVEIAAFNDQYTTNATVNSLSVCGIKAYKHTDNKFYALINPNYTTSTAPFLTLEVEDGTSKTTETLTTIPTTFVAGKSYTYKLTVGKNKISVSGITVKDWTTSKTIIDGKAEQIIPYVTFKADGEQKFKMITYGDYSISRLEYSVNNGKWQNVEKDIPVTFGGTHGDLRLRGTNINGTASEWSTYSTITFTDDVNVACTGNILTLLDWRNYNIVETNKAKFCSLFKDCSVLTTAPELPATKLAEHCYSSMFSGCTSLTSAPELKATTLARSCYSSMFSRCTSLEKAPELKATELAPSCYYNMFYGCTSLTTAPELKATTLEYGCYSSMFSDCTSLTDAPELKATTLVESCYESMFNGCTKLTSVTMLAPSDQISQATYCCYDWLYNAGTDETVTSRTLIVLDEAAYNALVNNTAYLPANWKKDATNTTVDYYTPKQ